MPNHLHGVVVINDMGRGGSRTAPTMDIAGPKPLGRLIGAFKTVSTKQINALRGTPGSTLWQRNYYEHVICGEAELDRVRRYVKDNPLMWDMDQENPGRQAGGERESWQV
jgi:putative transposase